jgi:hypothetical protein
VLGLDRSADRDLGRRSEALELARAPRRDRGLEIASAALGAIGPGLSARLDAVEDLLTPPDFRTLVGDLAERMPATWSELAYGVFFALAALLVAAWLLSRSQIAARRLA